MNKTDKVAIKSPSGFSYKNLEEVKINDVKLGTTIKGFRKQFGTVDTKNKDVKKLVKANTKLIDGIIMQEKEYNKQIKSLQDTIVNMKLNIITNRHNKIALAYQSFKVDLSLNLLPTHVKDTFIKNNSKGTRLLELQHWFINISTMRDAVIPAEIHLYMGGIS